MTETTDTETIVVNGDAIPLDLLVWRRFKRRTPGVVERTLALNPGLAKLGVMIPVGTSVVFPVDAPNQEPERRDVVRLWD